MAAPEDSLATIAEEMHRLGAQPDALPVHPSQMSAEEAAAFFAMRNAARRLRDAELDHRAAQEDYRKALDALNRAVAPVKEG
jgi:hypothetical protein